jgi:hypothetical protein
LGDLDACLLGQADELCHRIRTKLFHHPATMYFDSFFANAELQSNLFVTHASDDIRKDLILARNEPLDLSGNNKGLIIFCSCLLIFLDRFLNVLKKFLIIERLGQEMDRREYFTLGIPILMGAMISIVPKPFFHLFPTAIASLVGNSLVMGILFSLLLEHVLFRQRKDKR